MYTCMCMWVPLACSCTIVFCVHVLGAVSWLSPWAHAAGKESEEGGGVR